MTAGAGKAIAAGAPAGALQQRFPLARSAASRSGLASIFEIHCLVEEIISGAECRQPLTLLHHSHFPFKVALKADGVAPNRIELSWIQDRPFAASCEVLRWIAMAG